MAWVGVKVAEGQEAFAILMRGTARVTAVSYYREVT